MNENEFVKVDGVGRAFSIEGAKVEALSNVNLSVRRGVFLGIVGASGAGKSTLMHIMGGLDKPSSGKILYDGQDIYKMSDKGLSDFRSKRVGFVFQAHHLLPEFSALENVALPAMISGFTKSKAIEKSKVYLDRMGLCERLNHRPGKLSGGEQQRVAIARALVNSPDLILADEPTGNLDSKTGGDVFDLVMEINREEGKTFVIVTHNMTLANKMTRVETIKDGEFVFSQ